MISLARQSGNREIIVTLLESANRDGMDNLIKWNEEFFTSPASHKYHGAYQGGLAEHSLNVYFKLRELLDQAEVAANAGSIIIAGLLHDLCKVGAYTGTAGAYAYNKDHPEGHATQSVEIIKRFITLTDLEEKMIRYHMGSWRATGRNAEYTLEELHNAYIEYPAVNIMHIADQMATHIEIAEENR